jgi:hypothetical protein
MNGTKQKKYFEKIKTLPTYLSLSYIEPINDLGKIAAKKENIAILTKNNTYGIFSEKGPQYLRARKWPLCRRK